MAGKILQKRSVMTIVPVHIYCLQIDEGGLKVILYTLFIKVLLLLGWLLVRTVNRRHKTKTTLTRLGNILVTFSSFCRLHGRRAEQLLSDYQPGTGHQFQGRHLVNHSRSEVEKVFPDNLLNNLSSLMPGKSISRIAGSLTEVRYQLTCQDEDLYAWLAAFSKEYKAARNDYFTNIYELARLHDELREYIKGKPLTREAGEWIQGYFALFDEWTGGPNSDNISALHQRLVIKVKALNKRYPDITFSSTTNAKVLPCEQAFQRMEALDKKVCEKLEQYLRTYRRAEKITGLIGSRMLEAPGMRTVCINSPVTTCQDNAGAARKITIGFGLVIMAALCFLGGMYAKKGYGLLFAGKHDRQVVQRATSVTIPARAPATKVSFDTVQIVTGIDISKYQGKLLQDITAMDTIHFVICKATQGVTLTDPDFTYNWQRLQELRITRGAYHFFMSHDDPVKQAVHFLNTVGSLERKDLPLVVDIEEQSLTDTVQATSLQSALLVFLNYVEKATGCRPIIYTDRYFADTWLQEDTFAVYPLWLAQYTGRSFPVLPRTWQKSGHTFWQKSDSLSIASRKTDFDVFNGNGEQFTRFINSRY
jgi:GH25 family lysozyme M1 (1,4-beta-N-acetylmuramidase)